MVHEARLCAKSKSLAAACSARWQEGQSKVTRLPEHLRCTSIGISTGCIMTPSTLNLNLSTIWAIGYQHLKMLTTIRQKKRISRPKRCTPANRVSTATALDSISWLTTLATLPSKNQTIDRFHESIDVARWLPTPDMVHYIYSRTSPGIPPRAFLVDRFLPSITLDSFEGWIVNYPPAVLADMAIQGRRAYNTVQETGLLPEVQPGAKYHEREYDVIGEQREDPRSAYGGTQPA
jgi:hypothetical protein